MAHTLNVDPEALATTGNRVKDVAEQTKALMNSITKEIESLDPIWSGDVKVKFVDGALSKTGEISKLVQEFEEAGLGLNQTGVHYGELSDDVSGQINF